MIETTRCILRPAHEITGQVLLQFYQENEKHLAPWDPPKPSDFYTKNYWSQRVQEFEKEFEEQNSLRFNIFLKTTNEFIGTTNYTNFERGIFQNCRLGYKLGAKFQGQGLMHECLNAGIDFIFHKLNFHRIEANYIPENIRSGKVLRKLGFNEHGLAKDYLYIAGRWQDHILTSKVNPNWKNDF